MPLPSGLHVSKEKSAVNRIVFPHRKLFFLLISGFLSVFSFQKLDYNVSCHRFLWVYPVWSLLTFLTVWLYVFCQLREIFSHYFSEYFPTPLSFSLPGTLLTQMVDLFFVIVPQVPEAVFVLFQSVFSVIQIVRFLLFYFQGH